MAQEYTQNDKGGGRFDALQVTMASSDRTRSG